MPPILHSERALVTAVLAGDSRAAGRFLDVASPIVWSIVRKFEDGPDAELAFMDVVAGFKANGYARLQPYDGRAKLPIYVALAARDLLAERLARSIAQAPRQAWRRFERLFAADIRRRIAQRFPREPADREDVYQDLCLKLIEDDFRRVRAYDGRGSFIGYVLTIVDRLLIDRVRRDAPRPRLPAVVARLPPLERQIYIAIVWESCPADGRRLAAALRGRFERDPDSAEIHQALDRVAPVVHSNRNATTGRREMLSLDSLGADGNAVAIIDASPSAEESLLRAEEEASYAELLDAVKLAASGLPAEERCYLQILFSASRPLPPREIARMMGCRVGEVHRLRRRALRWIAEISRRLEKNHPRPSEPRNGDLDHGTASARAT